LFTNPDSTTKPSHPLSGITVVAIEQAIAAPLATRHLADLGARVIKIERPGEGDFARAYDTTVRGLSSHFVWVNRSKESLTLDLKQPAAIDIVHQLLASADVFVQNLAPGAVERLGLGAAPLRERYPRLIVCNVSGYGTGGPYGDRKAYDLLIQSEVGLLSITGSKDAPAKVGISVADIAGGMYAFSGILAALLQRGRTGQGSVLDISLLEALAEWMGYPLYYSQYGSESLGRSGAAHAAIAPYGPCQTSDGDIYLAVQNDREWQRFCAMALEKPELATDERFVTNARRVDHREDLQRYVDEVFSHLSTADVRARLDAAAIANSSLNSLDQFRAHEQLRARNRWRKVVSPVGPLDVLVPPISLNGAEPCLGPIPAVGDHTHAILAELGWTDADIDNLRASGAI